LICRRAIAKICSVAAQRFKKGDRVRVRALRPKRHVRTPAYIRGKTGTISATHGSFRNPEQLAYAKDGLPPVPLYGVTFKWSDVWKSPRRANSDTLVVDIYESWLQPAERTRPARRHR
jgi:hypothetical protein